MLLSHVESRDSNKIEKLKKLFEQAEKKQFEHQTGQMNQILLKRLRQYKLQKEKEYIQIRDKIELQQLKNMFQTMFQVMENQIEQDEIQIKQEQVELKLMESIITKFEEQSLKEDLEEKQQEIDYIQMSDLFQILEEQTQIDEFYSIQQKSDNKFLENLFQIFEEKVLKVDFKETKQKIDEQQIKNIFNIWDDVVQQLEQKDDIEVKVIQQQIELQTMIDIMQIFNGIVDKDINIQIEQIRDQINKEQMIEIFNQFDRQVLIQDFRDTLDQVKQEEKEQLSIFNLSQDEDQEQINHFYSSNSIEYKIYVHLKNMEFPINCGDALQRVKWLSDVALYKYQQLFNPILSEIISIKLSNGQNIDQYAIISSVLSNNSHIYIQFKDELQSSILNNKIIRKK